MLTMPLSRISMGTIGFVVPIPNLPPDSTIVESTIVLAPENFVRKFGVPPVVSTPAGDPRVGDERSLAAAVRVTVAALEAVLFALKDAMRLLRESART